MTALFVMTTDMKGLHEYSREVSVSAETFKKYRRKNKYPLNSVVAGWWKFSGITQLHRHEGSFVDQAVFATENPDVSLQGYVFKVKR